MAGRKQCTAVRLQMLLFSGLLMATHEALASTNGLRLTHLSVPSVVLAGESAWLNCSYDQGEDDLYSLKWYKDNVEILGYMPMEPAPSRVKIFNLTGVYIDLEQTRANPANIFLSHTDRFSEGRYRCEICGDGPKFRTARAHKDMTVVVIPPNGLVVSGVSEHRSYEVGDFVNVTCSYGPSRPNADLELYINDMKMPNHAEHTLVSNSFDDEGRSMVTKVLTFHVTESHFWKEALKLECRSLIRVEFNVSSEEIKIMNKGQQVEVSGRMDGPQVSGWQNDYNRPNSQVKLTCKPSQHGDPNRTPSKTMWLINDKEVKSPRMIKSIQRQENNVTLNFHELRFALNSADPSLQGLSKGQDIKIRCVTTEIMEFMDVTTRTLMKRGYLLSSASDSALPLQNHENRILGFLAAAYYNFVSSPHSSGSRPVHCIALTIVLLYVAVVSRSV